MVFQLDPAFEEGAAGLSFLVTAEPAELFDVQVATLRRALADDYRIIYVLTIHPYAPIREKLPEEGDRLHVIDCISRQIGVDEVDAEQVTYVDGPGNLDEIVARLGAVLHRFDQQPVILILDSVRGVLGYNTEEAVEDLLRTLTEKADTFDMRFKLFKSATDLPQYDDAIRHLFQDRIHVSMETAPHVTGDREGMTVTIPASVAGRLDWDNGERLEADLVDEKTLRLTREGD